MRALSKILLAYSSASLVQVLFRVLRGWLKKRRMLKMLTWCPRAKYTDGIMGSAPDALANLPRRHDWFGEITAGMSISYSEFGPKFDPHNLNILVKDPRIIKHFLKDEFGNYTKAPSDRDILFGHLRKWLGDSGIFTARHGSDASDGGQSWMRQRKVASAIFSRGNFNSNMNSVFVSKGDRFCEVLQPFATEGQAVDMQAKFFQFTMDSIMQIFFGERADTLGGQVNTYATAYDTAHRSLMEYFMTSVPQLAMSKMLPFPFGGFDGLAHKIHRASNPLYQEFLQSLTVLHNESRRIIEHCKADPSIANRTDLLALFIQAGLKDTSPDRAGFHTDWLRDVVLNFVIAGRDTTACTLSWMFYILATHPDIQRKVQEEIDAKFGSLQRKPLIQDVSASELPYLNGLLYETLRLYPPVPLDGKEASQDDVLPDGQKIPKHSTLLFMVYLMGRDPEVYPEPEVVKPERWIPFKEPSPFEFPVFQAGPRICLGMNMALFEAKICAAMLLQEYSFSMAPGEAEKITYLPTALTMSLCNSKQASGENTFDTHNLWLIPHLRCHPQGVGGA
jgi:cytochrome P450